MSTLKVLKSLQPVSCGLLVYWLTLNFKPAYVKMLSLLSCQVAYQASTYPGFLSTKRIPWSISATPHGMLVHHRVTPSSKCQYLRIQWVELSGLLCNTMQCSSLHCIVLQTARTWTLLLNPEFSLGHCASCSEWLLEYWKCLVHPKSANLYFMPWIYEIQLYCG